MGSRLRPISSSAAVRYGLLSMRPWPKKRKQDTDMNPGRPARASSASACAVWNTASTSSPSTILAWRPNASARRSNATERVARSMRVPMPYWLFTQPNSTGRSHSAAMFMLS